MPDQITLARQALLDLVESLENAVGRLFVGLLAGGKTGAVYAIIDVGVNKLVRSVDFAAEFGWIIIGMNVRERVEGRVEHTDNLGRFIIDDRLPLLIPQHRDRDSSGIMRIGEQIDFGERRF